MLTPGQGRVAATSGRIQVSQGLVQSEVRVEWESNGLTVSAVMQTVPVSCGKERAECESKAMVLLVDLILPSPLDMR